MDTDEPEDLREELRSRHTPRASISPECNAVVCWLRLNPGVAKTYGISEVNRDTSVGSMFMQTLQAQGAGIEWHIRLPDGAHAAGKKANEKAAAYIKRIYTRPGGRKKRLDERPEVAPPDRSAMLRHHGRLPRVSFPMLLKLSKYRRPKKTTACGNKVCRRRTPPPTCSHLPDHPHSRPDALHLPEQVVAPMPVVLAERDRITQYIERQLRCGCGKRLRFSKAASHQGLRGRKEERRWERRWKTRWESC